MRCNYYMSLDSIVKNNHYPIIFVGSGMSKRYLNDSPTWSNLLEEYWNKLKKSQNFYSHLHEINEEFEDGYKSRDEINYLTFKKLGTELEEEFKDEFYDGRIKVKDLSIKEAQQKNLSPFKFDLANRFSSKDKKDDLDQEEFSLFSKMLQKARMIVTTNYDPLIEDTIRENSNQRPKIFVGNSGFFENDANGWSEIYKIHGSYDNPESIIITDKDYEQYNKNSILISAKILSSMINSPIIFLGYSLTDRNVSNLLKDFSRQLPSEDSRKSADRIFIIEYKQNVKEINEEIMRSADLNFTYTRISTDNFKEIFKKIAKINEGITPYEVRRFESVIKKIIITSGQKNALDSYLVRPNDLNDFENKIDDGKPLVVAIGDSKNIIVTPTVTDYLEDYVSGKFEIYSESALRLITQNSGRLPFLRHLSMVNLNNCNLEDYEKKKIKDRFEKFEKNIDAVKNNIDTKSLPTTTNIDEILGSKDMNPANKINTIIYNIEEIDKNRLDIYVKNKALQEFIEIYRKRSKANPQTKAAYRKLFVAWDILTYGNKK